MLLLDCMEEIFCMDLLTFYFSEKKVNDIFAICLFHMYLTELYCNADWFWLVKWSCVGILGGVWMA